MSVVMEEELKRLCYKTKYNPQPIRSCLSRESRADRLDVLPDDRLAATRLPSSSLRTAIIAGQVLP
jgi:hypothetical protein